MSSRLSVPEFAHRTGFSVRTIWRYIASGRITPFRTPGGRPYFVVEDVARMQNGQPLSAEALNG